MQKVKHYLCSSMIAIMTIFTLAACGSDEAKEPAKTETQGEEVTVAGFPVTITDALDIEITIENQPERIVSLIPSNTEIVYALDSGDKLVGVSDFDNYPEEVTTKEKIGGMEFNVEKIISLKPDLVLAHESSAGTAQGGLDQLRSSGITVVVVPDATSFEGVYDSIKLIGTITGTLNKAKEIVGNMQIKLEEIKEKASAVTEKSTVWVEVSPAPEIYTTGRGTFIHEILETIGATNAAGDQEGWVMFTEEDAVILNPDVVVTTYGYYVENPKQQVLARAAWSEVTAIKNERVYDVHSDKVTRSGPRLIEGVEELAKAVYPEIFAK
ncbi:ABC transporter substrate-binding protein [Bacillus sp. DJP31]|uniref:ABC transporter substrate-binding protein n=1 Tax=Bacillus sp. DJP31 TaxID=3409789 RepID=UPI003BB5915E